MSGKKSLLKRLLFYELDRLNELLSRAGELAESTVVFDRSTAQGKSVLVTDQPGTEIYSRCGDTILLHLHEYQRAAWGSKKRHIALIAGTGGGKTSFGVWWLLRELSIRPAAVAMVVAPTFPMLQRIVLPAFLDATDALELPVVLNKQQFILEWGRRRVYFYSAEKPRRLEGVHADVIWLDEAGQMSEEVWEVIRRRKAVKKARLLITTTPYAFHSWLREYYTSWKAGEETDTDIFVFPSVANPAYPRAEFEDARKKLPEWKFRMFYLGEFTKPEGLVYFAFSPDLLVRDFPTSPDEVIAGLDWGLVNPTAIVLIYIKDGIFYLVHEYQASHRSLRQHITAWLQELKQRRLRPPEVIYYDPSGRQLAVEFQNHYDLFEKAGYSMPVLRAGNNAVEAGVNAVNELFSARRLLVFSRCAEFLKQIECYTFDQKGKPVKRDDHLLDAMRYAVFTHRERRGVGVY